MSKLALFCDRVIEAGWLAALVVAPLFFNYHSNTVFDPDKGAIIRSIAIVMLVAFVIRRLEHNPQSVPPKGGISLTLNNPQLTNWVSIIAILLFASYLFSSIVGVSFHTSWWGTYARAQGAYTLMGYFVIFIITLLSLKFVEQVNRMLTVIILTSIPVIIYGFAQKLKLDPLIWDTDFSRRIGSTLGNPIFLGSYLVIVIPITLACLLKSIGQRTQSIALAILLVLQLLCLWLTNSRGPFVGLMAGLFFFIVLSAIIYRRKWIAYIAYAGAVLLVGFLILLNIPDSPLSGIKPYFGRFGQIFESREPAARARLLIWEGVTNMVKSDTTRAVVGYGPENMFIPYHKYAPTELVRAEHKIAFPDRAHNELFDTLITNGLIGAFLYLMLFGGIIFWAFKQLSIIATSSAACEVAADYRWQISRSAPTATYKTQSLALIILLSLGGASGVILPYLLQGSFIYSSIGVPIGLVIGATAFLFYCLISRGNTESAEIKSSEHSVSSVSRAAGIASGDARLWQIGIFSALIGHFVETQFGIDLTASRTYFWILLPVLIVRLLERSELQPTIPGSNSLHSNCQSIVTTDGSGVLTTSKHSPASGGQGPSAQETNSPLLLNGIIGLLILTTLAFNLFFMQYSAETEASILKAVGLLGVTWIISGALLWCINDREGRCLPLTTSLSPKGRGEERGNGRQRGRRPSLTYFAITLIGTGIFVFILSMFLPPLVSPINTIMFFSAWLAIGIFAIAWSLAPLASPISAKEKGKSEIKTVHNSSSIGIAVVTVIIGILIIFYTNINPIRGNILYKIGSSHEKIKQWDTVLWHYQEALKHSADNSYYYAPIARVYMEKSYLAKDAREKEPLLKECISYILKSIEYERFSPTRNANVGRYYRVWAQTAPTPAERQTRYEQSHKYYQIACSLSPHNPSLMNEWGETYYEQRNLAEAIARYEAALKIDPKFSETFAHLGDIYLDKQDIAKATEYYYQAALIHKDGQEVMKEDNQELLFERTNRMLIKYKPDDYLGYYNLMNFYLAKGRKQEASAMAQKVRQLAPNIPVPVE